MTYDLDLLARNSESDSFHKDGEVRDGIPDERALDYFTAEQWGDWTLVDAMDAMNGPYLVAVAPRERDVERLDRNDVENSRDRQYRTTDRGRYRISDTNPNRVREWDRFYDGP